MSYDRLEIMARTLRILRALRLITGQPWRVYRDTENDSVVRLTHSGMPADAPPVGITIEAIANYPDGAEEEVARAILLKSEGKTIERSAP